MSTFRVGAKRRGAVGAIATLLMSAMLWLSYVPGETTSELDRLLDKLAPPSDSEVVVRDRPFSRGLRSDVSVVVKSTRSCPELMAYYEGLLAAEGFSLDGPRLQDTVAGGTAQRMTRGKYCVSVTCLRDEPDGPGTCSVFVSWRPLRMRRC